MLKKLTPKKIAALLIGAVGAAEMAKPYLPPQYHAPLMTALPFVSLLAGLLAPQPHKKLAINPSEPK